MSVTCRKTEIIGFYLKSYTWLFGGILNFNSWIINSSSFLILLYTINVAIVFYLADAIVKMFLLHGIFDGGLYSIFISSNIFWSENLGFFYVGKLKNILCGNSPGNSLSVHLRSDSRRVWSAILHANEAVGGGGGTF